MKIFVVGMGHLGTVTATCLAQCSESFGVLAYDLPPHNRPYEDLLPQWNGACSYQALKQVFDPIHAEECDLIWVAIDTPIVDGVADVENVLHRIHAPLIHAKHGTLVIVSSQLPVGTISKLAAKYPLLSFAANPENLRIGKGIGGFKQPDRVIVGLQNVSDREIIERVFEPFCTNIVWMGIESAEMVKHMLNAYLAMQVAFANEMGKLCIQVGASPHDVTRGLKSDSRVGQHAYLGYGGGPGPHLMREVNFLHKKAGGLFSAIKASHEDSGAAK